MKEKVLMEIQRISLIETIFGEEVKSLDFRFINQSTYHGFSDEEVDCEINKEQAIELISELKRFFEIK